ncbi:MAG: hypothetical protein AAF688_14560 [Bacteroidota bacterium]
MALFHILWKTINNAIQVFKINKTATMFRYNQSREIGGVCFV